MRRTRRIAAVFASLVIPSSLALPAAAFAQDHPVFLPTKDVAVTYQLTSGGAPAQVTHLYYSAAANKLRIDSPGNAGFTVLDRAGGQRLMVMNQDQAYMAVPMDPAMADGFVLNSQMGYVRGGADSVAGVPCTDWTVKSQQADGSACVTADGVLLRGSGHSQQGDTGLVATSVSYAPQPDSLFQPPANFKKMDPSQMQGPPPGAGGPPGQGGPDAGGPPPGQGGPQQ